MLATTLVCTALIGLVPPVVFGPPTRDELVDPLARERLDESRILLQSSYSLERVFELAQINEARSWRRHVLEQPRFVVRPSPGSDETIILRDQDLDIARELELVRRRPSAHGRQRADAERIREFAARRAREIEAAGGTPPTYVPPTDEEKEDPEVRKRLDAERALIREGLESPIEVDVEALRKIALPAIGEVLDAFHAHAAGAEFDAYFALMHEDGVFLGTDATERWTKSEFMEYARPVMIDQGRGWAYHPRDRHIATDRGVRTAWFDELLDHDKYGVLRGSGVLVLTPDGWRIMQYNLAFTVPNDDAPEVVELIRRGGED